MGHVQTVQTQIRASDLDLLYLQTKCSINFQIYKVVTTKKTKYFQTFKREGVGFPQGMILNTYKVLLTNVFSKTFLHKTAPSRSNNISLYRSKGRLCNFLNEKSLSV